MSPEILALVGVFGGLVGSILTVLITKLLDLLQKSKEQKYFLQRAFFAKKLESAEAAVSQWYTTISAISGMAALYEKPPVFEGGMHPEVFDHMNHKLTSLMGTAQLHSGSLARSFLLYFDVDDSFWSNSELKSFFDQLSNVIVIATKLRMLLDLEDSVVGTDDEEPLRQAIHQTTEELKPELKAFVDTFEGARQSTINLLKQVRTEMKRYEP